MKKHINALIILGLGLSIFTGCSSDSNSTPAVVSYAAQGTIVDPYIVGAVMCEDVNKDGVCSSDEQLSTASDANGVYKFINALAIGSHIIIKTQGTHEGVTYNLNLSSIVSSASSAGTTSPLTTLNTRGLTTAQIVTILIQAKDDAINNDGALNLANFVVTTSDISIDPLSGGLMDKIVSQITDAELSKIQASISTYGLLKIMDGSTTLSALSGDALVQSGITGGEVNLIARAILKAVSDGLNRTLLTSIEDAIELGRDALVASALPRATADNAFPEANIGLVVRIAVKVIDRLATIGYTTCNTTTGTDAQKVAAALTAVGTEATTVASVANIMKIGKMLYAAKNRAVIKANLPAVYLSGLAAADADLWAGVDSTATTFNFGVAGAIQ